MSRICACLLSAAILLSALSLTGCLKDEADETAADAGAGSPSTTEVEGAEIDVGAPALTLTADLVDRWIASAEHEAVARVLGSITVRATRDAPAVIEADIQQAVLNEGLGEAVRGHEFSGAEEWALVTTRVMSGLVEALGQAHLDLAREMGIDETSAEYQKAAKEVKRELTAAHEILGPLSEAEQKIVTDRLGDIMSAMRGDSAPDSETEATE